MLVQRRHRAVVGAVGVVLILLGSVLHWSASVVRGRLLDADFYSAALEDQGVYQRVYTEVLVDPDVREVTGHLLGDITIDGAELRDAAALSNAVLRLALPPTTLRQATERTIDAVLGYVRGERAHVDASVDLSRALRTLDVTVETLLSGVLTLLPRHVVDNLPDYELAVRSFVRQLEAGEVPDWLPVLGGAAVSGRAVVAVIERASEIGLPPDVAAQVAVSAGAGDEADALIAAAASYATEHASDVADDPAVESRLRIDLFDALGRRAGEPQRDVIEQLNTMRDWARWVPSWSGPVALAVITLGVVLVWLSAVRIQLAMVALAGAFAAASAVTWVVRVLAGRSFRSPITQATASSAANTWPQSIARIVRDVDRSISESLRATAEAHTSRLFVVALACAAAAGVVGVREWVRRTDVRVVIAVWAGVVAVSGWFAVWLPAPTAHVAERRCNGHAELCDRPYDEVVQAASHNAMSSPRVVRIWPEHDGDIEAQLNYGIRTLLIDTHYWEAVETPAELSSAEQYLPPEVAEYLFSELDERLTARPGTYLCHSTCAYGAVSFEAALATVKRFLDANPSEVVTLIIQDAITVADTEAAFRAAGLEDYVFAGDTDDGWPTLGELIDDARRLVVFSESGGGSPPWYRSAFEEMRDTSFRVRAPDDFTCKRNRGPTDAPLFLLNHWIARTVPDRADAAVVNSREFIVDRARRCAEATGTLPNYIAVNFFSIGDVTGAVDELNGFAP